MTNLPPQEWREITRADIKVLKAKRREAKDRLSREYYAALLEGMKESPWYYDNNAPSLYRDRMMELPR
jgi:hypothetical protein